MQAGTRIGPYEIQRRIGTGAMGSVYLARDVDLDRFVAIKILRDASLDDELLQRFLREARAIARLRHENIITVYNVGEHDGYPYMAMEYVDGTSLAGIIRERQPLSLATKLLYIEQICAGLQHAHGAGIVHRDVKPSNVMVDRRGVVRILDFGIARLAGSGITQDGALVGTLNYMSPEQMFGHEVDYRSDIFAVGLVAYELLAYRQAFPYSLHEGLLHRLTNDDPEPLARFCPGLSPELEAIVLRAMTKAPEARYQALDDMRRALRDVRRAIEKEEGGAIDRDALGTGADSHPATAGELKGLTEPRPDHPGSVHLPAAPAPAGQDEAAAAAASSGNAPAAAPDPLLAGSPTILLTSAAVAALEGAAAADAQSDATILFTAPGQGSRPPETPDVQLVVTDSTKPHAVGRVYPLPRADVILGRDGQWLALADAGWSRQHAVIRYLDGGYVIADLGSANGTRVNGFALRPDRPHELFFGSRITIGSTVLTFSSARVTAVPDLQGAEIDGRYVLEQRLRDGAKAALYAARDKRLPGRVAVKLLSPQLSTYPGYRDRFQREAELARRLQHPHVCQVLDYGYGEVTRHPAAPLRTYYMCLSLMEGGNLTDRLEGGPVERTKALEWIQRIGAALDYAHRCDVVHGDIKPSAVVFDADGNPYLTDFAVAQRSTGGGGYLAGVPAFMAPEHWQAGALTPAADQFGLAALAYYLLTGSRPFEGQDHPEIRRRNFARGPLPAHSEAEHNGRPGLPRGVSYVLEKALAPAPDHRYATIAEFTAALAAALIRPARRPEAAPVFLSYHRDTASGWVNYFAERLRGCGLQVFLDTHARDAGPFPEQLASAIEDCAVFVCFVSERALAARWVQHEIDLAHQYDKAMIPVFLDAYRPPATEPTSPAINALLLSHGVHLPQNVSPEGTVAELAQMIRAQIEAV